MTKSSSVISGLLSTGLIVLAVGLISYLVFRSESSTLSLSFLLGVPIMVGVVTVLLAPAQYQTSTAYGLLMPWLPCITLCVTTVLVGWELAICVIMALPIFLLVSSISGFAMVAYKRRRQEKFTHTRAMISIVILLPHLVVLAENQISTPDAVRTVETQIKINASPETVWENIIAVSEIQPDERRFSILGAVGFPKPVEASLSYEGVGGMRRASYENGLVLLEPVTQWDLYRQYAFGVELDPQALPSAPFNQIGGQVFDVGEVGFRLEPSADGGVILHLHTTYRLSTKFNFYGALWVDYLTRDLQKTILHVVKLRAEAQE